MRVLVAEDNMDIHEMIGLVLHEIGVNVTLAASCNEAHKLLATEQWDVLLTDLLFLERRTGFDLANDAACHGIRAVVMSGAQDKREDVEARGVAFLAKPFSLAQLLGAIGCA